MTSSDPSDGPAAVPSAPPAPPAAARIFGPRLGLAARYADRLASDGTVRGLIGPREVERLWVRHLLNSAVLSELLPTDARVVDVGSGAGLPGLPIAIRRPDLRVDLVEPMLRRTDFLSEVVRDLDLGERVRVVRGRAEDGPVRTLVGSSDWVVARAVAPLDRLVKWCLPLLAPGGRLLALKGSSATEEVAAHRSAVTASGGVSLEVQRVGESEPDAATWVIVVQRSASGRPGQPRKGRA